MEVFAFNSIITLDDCIDALLVNCNTREERIEKSCGVEGTGTRSPSSRTYVEIIRLIREETQQKASIVCGRNERRQPDQFRSLHARVISPSAADRRRRRDIEYRSHLNLRYRSCGTAGSRRDKDHVHYVRSAAAVAGRRPQHCIGPSILGDLVIMSFKQVAQVSAIAG